MQRKLVKTLPSVALLAALATLSACQKNEPAATPAAPAAAEKPADTAITVTVTDKGCDPSTLSVPSGKRTFKIINKSQQALEWEILKGVMVVEERENIAPGFTQTLTATLEQGEYDITCGLLTNPKGKLTVTAGDAVQSNGPAIAELQPALEAYKQYVAQESDAFVTMTEKFVKAIKAGKLKEAQALYPQARVHYERIEPIAELFSDLDGAIDARADDFEKKEQDPTFTGYHRLEYALFEQKTTKGQGEIADKLLEDVKALKERISQLALPAGKVVGGAAALIEEVASGKISGEEDRYSHTDLWDFNSNVEGAKKVVDLLRPLLDKRDAELLKRVDANFAEVDALLAKYRSGKGFKDYGSLTEADKTAMKGPITALAEDLSKLRGTLGLE
ncbi:iron uptake system protein EfeO [Curvibacter sp. CHRR-16]|uniref:iron uptake system protein EfeO n=1 Tax=Curvibacter sp. CHRR-16 TaxID=2835872 RepID=UPI001BD99EEF|nr:iron uptake system protein EfeO [Curvibacter sp. CHRR-16]MBT0570010.1 iron uptake system protein EfeO [Curvibacter sp. CHRR-16]